MMGSAGHEGGDTGEERVRDSSMAAAYGPELAEALLGFCQWLSKARPGFQSLQVIAHCRRTESCNTSFLYSASACFGVQGILLCRSCLFGWEVLDLFAVSLRRLVNLFQVADVEQKAVLGCKAGYSMLLDYLAATDGTAEQGTKEPGLQVLS